MTPPGSRWRPAYIGIGSNLKSPVDQVRSAIDDLAKIPQSVLVSTSSLYRSEPMGSADQPDYINAAAAMLTQLPADEFMRNLARIEDQHGRERAAEQWGPRVLDLDLLVFSTLQLDSDTLTVPHPGIAARNFVLLPLSEIAPQLWVPGHGSVVILLAALGTDSARIEKL